MPSSTIDPMSSPGPAEVVREHEEPLPGNFDSTLALLKRVLVLRGMTKIEITPQSIKIRRRMLDERSPVLPDDVPNALTADDVLERVPDLDLWETPGTPAAMTIGAIGAILNRGLRVVGVIAPRGEFLGAFQGLPPGTPVSTCYGHDVLWAEGSDYENRLIFIGAKSFFFSDAEYGIVVDPFLPEAT